MRCNVAFLMAALLAAACGSGASDATPTDSSKCVFSGPAPKAPPTPDAGSAAQTYVEAEARTALDAFIGVYLRGDTTVYRGSLNAHDNQGVLGPPPSGGSPGYENQTISEGAAVASLRVADGTATFAIHSFASHKYLVLEQDTRDGSDRTSIGIILPDTSLGGNSGTCTGCVPAFGARPDTISFSNAESTQVVNIGSVGSKNQVVTLHTYATANLSVVAVCDIAFADLNELNAPSGLSFVEQNGEWIHELSGQTYDPTSGCPIDYSIELYVSATNFADYGVRGYTAMTESGCEG